ncbi:MAG: TlpA family protein disulfide reductase [Janthinobacterium lividum]
MKQAGLGVLWVGALGLGACSQADPAGTKVAVEAVAATPALPQPPPAARPDTLASAAAMAAKVRAVTTDYPTWYSYTYYHVPLARQFEGLGPRGQAISTKDFLGRLASGKYLAMRRGSSHNVPVYQLYAYGGKLAQIGVVSQHLAQQELYNQVWKGKPAPAFNLIDLAGVAYTPASTRGKVLVLKCWFISCVGCVREFPQANALAATYRANKDVCFISLTTDDAVSLRAFLQSKPLAYATVPNCMGYMQNKLKVNGYPTHIVIGRDGRIAYVSNYMDYLPAAINKALQAPAPQAIARNSTKRNRL